MGTLIKTSCLAAMTVVTVVAAVVVSGGVSNPYHMEAAGILTAQECLDCHNGMVGIEIRICTGTECLYSKSHSLMRRYPPPGKERQYAPLSTIKAAGCLLEDGKVTCLSCHDLTKPANHLIREGDELCRICHLAQ